MTLFIDKRFKGTFTYEEYAVARHFRIVSKPERMQIVQLLETHGKLRMTQIMMETGMTREKAYYEVGVLKKEGYVYCRLHKGRTLVRFAPGYHERLKVVRAELKKLLPHPDKNRGHLKVDRGD